MASHLAAQDYLARLQASGLNFPPLGDPYAALSALSGGGMKQPVKPVKQSNRSERYEREDLFITRFCYSTLLCRIYKFYT